MPGMRTLHFSPALGRRRVLLGGLRVQAVRLARTETRERAVRNRSMGSEGAVTTAEANNERATVEELDEELIGVVAHAQCAGLPDERIARQLVILGVIIAAKAGIPRQGLHDISAWLGHCHKAAGRALDELDKEAG